MKPKKDIPSWLLALVILVTAGVTIWVMLQGDRSRARTTGPYYSPLQVAQSLSPGIAAVNQGAFQVAGAGGIPVIRAGAVPLHADCGVCTNCHGVVGSRGNPIPNISASSIMLHENRGVCSNCHQLASKNGFNLNTGSRQAAAPAAATGRTVASQALSPWTIAPASTATEGEWLGLEVAPITQLTAGQYGIPYGTSGLVVAEAEAQAAAASLRAGDVVVSVNGVSIGNMGDFFQATKNGTQTQGVVEVLRKGQRLTVNLGGPGGNPAAGRSPSRF